MVRAGDTATARADHIVVKIHEPDARCVNEQIDRYVGRNRMLVSKAERIYAEEIPVISLPKRRNEFLDLCRRQTFEFE